MHRKLILAHQVDRNIIVFINNFQVKSLLATKNTIFLGNIQNSFKITQQAQKLSKRKNLS